MIPHPNITFGAGLTEDRMTPVGLAVLLIAAVLVLILPRKWVVVPLLISVFLVPGQQFVIGGVHLFANRIVTLLGCLRFLFKFNSATSPLIGGFTSIDRIFLIWAVCRATAFVILYHVGDAVVNQIGFLWDGLGGYFLLRCLVRNVEDIRRIAKVFVVIAVIVAGCMLYEHYKLTNIFAVILGGKTVPDIREGKIRCRGPFEQQIIASVFGGTLVPLCDWSGWMHCHYNHRFLQHWNRRRCRRDWSALPLAVSQICPPDALGICGHDRGSCDCDEGTGVVCSGAR